MTEYKDTPPVLKMTDEEKAAFEELKSREPLFHQPKFGRKKEDFLRMTDERFFEVGASGRRYNREYVIDGVSKRYEDPEYNGVEGGNEKNWKIKEPFCRKLEGVTFLFTYTLLQDESMSRRSTVWQKSEEGWKIIYHQGTIVE